MNKGIVLHLDDDNKPMGILERSKNYFDQLNLGLDYVCCSSVEDFKQNIKAHPYNIKALIFDLVGVNEEGVNLQKTQTEFIKELEIAYKNLRVPMFIFSAHLNEFGEYEQAGTVYRFDKGDGKFESIAEQIKLLNNSGFLNIFSQGGYVENTIMHELHEAFIWQFRGNEISEIITAIGSIKNIDHNSRIKDTFQRIAVRSLISRLMIDKTVVEEKFNEVKISAVEHYIRRTNLSNIPIWTGDIFEAKDASQRIIVLTPRCDVATKGKKNLLVGLIEKAPDLTKKNADDFMKDNIKTKKFRYLPKTPVFEGGKANLSEQFTLSDDQLKEKYNYIISLSEDLTNEILGKFCAYFLRTSVPEVSDEDLKSFFDLEANGKKQ